MSRAFLIVLDSFGIGSAADASAFDRGSNTLGHIAQYCADASDRAPLNIPHLCALGLNEALKLSAGKYGAQLPIDLALKGSYGYAIEQSAGKDTPSGHWEMAGLPVHEDWGYFSQKQESFPQDLLVDFVEATGVPGYLANCHGSGTELIKQFGLEHVQSGKPIVYTSADSVFQIAAHETHFGLERLYEICDITRKLVDPYRIGRVIARPFIGETAETFARTANRRDLATPPFADTLLDCLQAEGRDVNAIGKIGDIFAHRGTSVEQKTVDNADGVNRLFHHIETAQPGSLTFVNLNDFDTLYGHRRNVLGYATALEQFDLKLLEIIEALQPGDLAIISADHGCDPTWEGSDHTREHIPVLAFGPGLPTGSIGARHSFADIGQTIAKHLGIAPLAFGDSWL